MRPAATRLPAKSTRSRKRLEPQANIDDASLKRGLRVLTVEVAFSASCDAVMTGVILTAFALHNGASETQIGILAAVAFWAQLLQGPGVLLVDRLRRRKAIAVVGSLVSSIAPASLAALAFAAAGGPGAPVALIAAVALYCCAGAFAGCAWNAWTRDLVPDDVRGRFFARRSRLATVASVGMGLLAASALDLAPEGSPARPLAFAALFALAFVAQWFSAATLSRAVEPMMPDPGPPRRLRAMLAQPLRDPDFRSLIRFTASWQFAVNLAQPFFTVFILKQLGFSVTMMMALTIISQLANIWSLKRWGVLADRYGFKSILNVAAPAFLLCVAGMIGASQFAYEWLTFGYLVVLHIFLGMATAGVALGSGSIAQALSPKGEAAAYLSANGVISSVIGGIAPILGGLGAHFFAVREFGIVLEWTGPRVQGEIAGLRLSGWDFYFAISALCGLYALHRLAMVKEEGEVERRELMTAILERARSHFGRPPGGAGPPEELSAMLAEDETAAKPGKSGS
jgi:MFS family permease